MVYGARSVITILDHLQRKSHVEKYILKKTNFSLTSQSTLSSTYGLHLMYKEFMLPEKTLPVNSNISLSDWIKHMEGMVLSFIAEYSLLFFQLETLLSWRRKWCVILKLQTNYKLLANCIVQNVAWLSQTAGKPVSRQTERRIFQF